MAPSPVLNIEPKEPDKNNHKFKEIVSIKGKQTTSKIESGSSSKDKVSVSINFSPPPMLSFYYSFVCS